MILLELFDTGVEFKQTRGNDFITGWEFEVNGIRYWAMITPFWVEDEHELGDILELTNNAIKDITPLVKDGRSVSIFEFSQKDQKGRREYRHDITGTGSQYKVFATVMNILETVKKAVGQGTLIVMSAKSNERSRVKLYDRFAKLQRGVKRLQGTDDIHYAFLL